jgi:hypothetical protein
MSSTSTEPRLRETWRVFMEGSKFYLVERESIRIFAGFFVCLFVCLFV